MNTNDPSLNFQIPPIEPAFAMLGFSWRGPGPLLLSTQGYRNPNGPDRLKIGREGFRKALKEAASKPAPALAALLQQQPKRHRAEAPQRNDMTLLALERP